MRMTINEAIAEIESEYLAFLRGTGLDNPKYMKEQRKQNLDCDRVCSANEMAINIIRKYQKIKQVLDDWENSGEEDDPINILDNIIEVMEDGNVD